MLGSRAVSGLEGAGRERRAEAPGWLRWGALGCGAVALLLLVLLLGGAFSARRLLAVGVTALQRRVVGNLPGELSADERQRIDGLFGCVATAVADGRLDEVAIAPLGRAVNSAFADRVLSVEEAGTLATAAEELCAGGRAGQ